jgi:ribonucleoside-diphosphate reductase alpha chain
MIAGCASGIEPIFALAWKKQNILEGKTLYYSNPYFEQVAKDYGFYSEELMEALSEGVSLQSFDKVPQWVKDVYVTAPEISAEDHVHMQASFQEHVDAGISKTINFSNEATPQDVEDAYLKAWETGCKGITVYRSGSREKEVLVAGHEENTMVSCGCDSPFIVQESGCMSCKSCGWSACEVA